MTFLILNNRILICLTQLLSFRLNLNHRHFEAYQPLARYSHRPQGSQIVSRDFLVYFGKGGCCQVNKSF